MSTISQSIYILLLDFKLNVNFLDMEEIEVLLLFESPYIKFKNFPGINYKV